MINYVFDYARRIRVNCFHKISRERKNKELAITIKEMNHNILAINSLINMRELGSESEKVLRSNNLKEISEIYSILYAKMKAKINNSIMCIHYQ